MLWAEVVHTCKCVRNSMVTTGITNSPFGFFYEEKAKIIYSFLEFGRIAYVTKRDKIKKKIMEKTYKAIMVGYPDNHKRDTYYMYNPETKRVTMTRDVKWVEWKMTDTAEKLNMFRDSNEEYLVPDIYEDKIHTSKPEDKLTVNIILDVGEIVRLKENSK